MGSKGLNGGHKSSKWLEMGQHASALAQHALKWRHAACMGTQVSDHDQEGGPLRAGEGSRMRKGVGSPTRRGPQSFAKQLPNFYYA